MGECFELGGLVGKRAKELGIIAAIDFQNPLAILRRNRHRPLQATIAAARTLEIYPFRNME